MREEKKVITVNSFQHNLLINGINEFRNVLLAEQQPTEDVDSLLIKIIDAPTQRETRKFDRENR